MFFYVWFVSKYILLHNYVHVISNLDIKYINLLLIMHLVLINKNSYLYATIMLFIFFTYSVKINFFITNDLLYGALKYHLPLLYFAIILRLNNNTKLKEILSCTLDKRIIYILFFSLICGSLWSLNNITWGYIWLGDLIEIFLIIILLLFVYVLHKKKKTTPNQAVLLNTIILYIFCLRIGLFKTRHNFLSLLNVNQTILVYIYTIYVRKKLKILKINNEYYLTKLFIMIIYILILNLCTYTINLILIILALFISKYFYFKIKKHYLISVKTVLFLYLIYNIKLITVLIKNNYTSIGNIKTFINNLYIFDLFFINLK